MLVSLLVSTKHTIDHVHYTDPPLKTCKINGNGFATMLRSTRATERIRDLSSATPTN